jgi:hypothetical protein
MDEGFQAQGGTGQGVQERFLYQMAAARAPVAVNDMARDQRFHWRQIFGIAFPCFG